MQFTIYFCADGILRAKFSDNKPMIPLKFLQNESGKDDFQFWVCWWKNPVLFEDGLTFGKFLICLEPWSQFWSDMTDINLKSYFTELRKPLIVNNNHNPEIDNRQFDWVNIVYRSELEPTTEYLKEEQEIEDLQEWFNSPKTQRLTGKWSLQSSYVINGFHIGEAEHYSINYTPLNELANVPLYLAKDHQITISDFDLKRILGSKAEFFKKNTFGVNTVVSKGFKNKKYEIKFLIEEKRHTLREMIEGFFHWMYREPATRDDFIETLKEIKDNLTLEPDVLSQSSDIETTQDNFEHTSNVIAINSKNISSENNHELSQDIDNAGLEIKVAPGAFSPLVESLERDNDYWEEMISNAAKDPNVILKIGQVTLAEQPENRIFNLIIDPNDPKANPQPSEYKTN